MYSCHFSDILFLLDEGIGLSLQGGLLMLQVGEQFPSLYEASGIYAGSWHHIALQVSSYFIERTFVCIC